MKKVICLVLVMLIMTGCTSDKGQPVENDTQTGVYWEVNSTAEGIRTASEEGFVVWVNYSEDERIRNSSFNKSNGKNGTLPVYRIDSKEELVRFINEFGTFLTLDQKRGETDSFLEIANQFDSAFFTSNSLLMTYHIASSGSYEYGLNRTDISGSDLIIHIVQTNSPEIGTCDMAGWMTVIPFSKTTLEKITDYDAVLDGYDHENHSEERYETFEGGQPVQLPGHIVWGRFSYEKDCRIRQEQNLTVQSNGFVNTEPVDDFIPIEQAKKELSEDFLLRQTFHDDIEGIWKLRFFNDENGNGPETLVYIDSNGVTRLIVKKQI